MAKVGDKCSNGPDMETWTCPECYNDHDGRVKQCEKCGTPLKCTIERPPIAVCTVIDPNEPDDEEDEE